MTKDIQRLKKQLLMEELRRQGRVPKRQRWLLAVLLAAILAIGGGLWYRANLQDILEDRFQEALALREDGRYRAALEQLEELSQGYPQFARADRVLFEAAEIRQLFLEEYSDALLTYLLLVRDYPDSPLALQAQRQVATIYKYRLGDCGQAIAAYQKVLDQDDPANDQPQYEVADCYFRLNNFEQARIEFESLLKGYPESPLTAEVGYRIGVTYALEEKLPEAVGAYRRVMDQWPESPYALESRFALAVALEEQEKLLESLAVLEGLVGEYPNPEALNRRIEQVKARIEKKQKAI